MKKWELLFAEDPPDGHDENVYKAVAPLLENAKKKQRKSRFEFLFNWKFASLASGGALAVVLAFIYKKGANPGDQELLALQEIFGEKEVIESANDVEVIAEEDFDFELIDNLEFIEELEDV